MTVKTGLGFYPTNGLVITGQLDQTNRLERTGTYNAATGTTLGRRVACHRLYAPKGANDQFDSVRNNTAWTSKTDEYLSMNSGHVVLWSCSGDGTTGTVAKNSGPFYQQISGGFWDTELKNTFARIYALDWGGAVTPIPTTTGSKEVVPGSQYGGSKPTEMVWLQNHEPNINTGTTRGTAYQFAGMMKHLAVLHDTWKAGSAYSASPVRIKFAACISNPVGTTNTNTVAGNFYGIGAGSTGNGDANDITKTGTRPMDYGAWDIYSPWTENASNHGPVTANDGVAFGATSKYGACHAWTLANLPTGTYDIIPEYAIRMPTSPVSGGAGPAPTWPATWFAGCDTYQAANLVGGNYPVKYMSQYVAASVLSNTPTGGADNSIIPDQTTHAASYQLAEVSLRPAFTAFHDQLAAWTPTGTPGVVPTGVTAPTITAGQTSGTLTWTTNAANVSYNVYKNGVLTQSGITAGSTTIYADHTIPLPQTATYGVTGIGANGAETAMSTTVSVTFPAASGVVPGTAVAPVVSNVGQTTATATVTAVATATGYNWFLDGNVGTPDYTSTGNSVPMTGLAAGSHTVKVLPFNAAGPATSQSPASASFTMASAPDTTPPSVPTGLAATATAAQVILTWNPSTDTPATGAVTSGMGTYDVTRTDPINGTVLLSNGSLAATTFTDPAPPAQATGVISATYAVRALDVAGNPSAYATLVVAIPQLPTGANPVAVLNLPATVAAGQLFSFDAASSIPGSAGPITSYSVTISDGAHYLVTIPASSVSSWRTSLPTFGQYTFTLTVTDASGASGTVQATTIAAGSDGLTFPYTGALKEIPGQPGTSAGKNNAKFALIDNALQGLSDRIDSDEQAIASLAPSLLTRATGAQTVPVPPIAVSGDIPTVTSGGSATITGQLVGPQAGLITEVGSRGTWDSTFGRLPVSGKSGLDFYLTGSAVEIHVFPGLTGACPIWIWVNGAPVTATPSSVTVTSSTDVYIKLTFGTSDRRRIEFFMPHGGSWYDVRAALSAIITPAPRKPVIAWVGDSFYGGSSGTPAMQCADFLASRLLGCECYSQSFGGTGYVTAGSFNVFGDPARVAAVAAANPDLIVIQGSVNDDGGAGIQAAASAAYSAYAVACPQAWVIVLGPQPSAATATLSANRSANIAAVAAAAVAAPNVLAFHDMVGSVGGVPATAASFQTYPDGTLLKSLGSVWQVSNGGASYAGGPLLPPADGHFALQTWVLFGTGQVGTTTGDGNRDTLVYSDGIHPTVEASVAYALRTAETIRNDVSASQ